MTNSENIDPYLGLHAHIGLFVLNPSMTWADFSARLRAAFAATIEAVSYTHLRAHET